MQQEKRGAVQELQELCDCTCIAELVIAWFDLVCSLIEICSARLAIRAYHTAIHRAGGQHNRAGPCSLSPRRLAGQSRLSFS